MEYFLKNYNEKYYYEEEKGIMMSRLETATLPKIIFKDAKESFSVTEKSGIIHIICISGDNYLTYIVKRDDNLKKYTLLKIKEECIVKKIGTTVIADMIHLIYSAEYRDEVILVHCVLGNNAKPVVIDKMEDENFFIGGGKVYYTNKAGVLGFQDFSDGKPDRFEVIAKDAKNPYLYRDSENEYLVYKKGDAIYINHELKAEDSEMRRPIIVKRNGRTLLIWESGAVLKYIDIKKDGEDVPHFMVSTSPLTLCQIIKNGKIYYDYMSSGNIKKYHNKLRN